MLRTSLLLFYVGLVAAQCGSLVTYRQHTDLLKTAPQCLREGCRQGDGNTTISSPCPSESSCSTYWNIFVDQFDQKNSWCSTPSCNSDPACRISGWPVMNATTLCQSSPNLLLFDEGVDGCCTQNNEMFELAAWTKAFCNGSEWRQQFDICGGMACDDWHEWIMPWNWTVTNFSRSADQQECTSPSQYLGIYAGEHFFWLLATFGLGWVRLRLARHEEKHDRSVLRFWAVSAWYHWTGFSYEQKKDKVEKKVEGEQYRPSFTDPLGWGYPVLMGALMAGLELGFDFFAAYIIKSAPGYEHVPLDLLAFLLCCRPRLSWLSCLLAVLISEERLQKHFKFKPGGDGLWAAKIVLSSVAVTSAVTEAILQLIGAYFLGKTAHVGAVRGFYQLHHIRPKDGGRDARHMYLGALFWALLCVPLVAVWFVTALFYGAVFHKVSSWRRSIFHFIRPKKEKVPKIFEKPIGKLIDKIYPGQVPPQQNTIPQRPTYTQDQPWIINDDQPFPVPTGPYDLPMPYDDPANSGLYTHNQPFLVRNDSQRNRYAPLPQLDDQPLMVRRGASNGSNRVTSGGYIQENIGVQRRTRSGGQYGAIIQNDDLEIESDDLPLPIHKQPLPIRQHISYYEKRYDESSNSLLPPSTGETTSSNRRDEYTDKVSLKWQQWEPRIIWAGAFLGILAYASQWIFWDGFVKAAGDKFCPPSLWKLSGLWWGGAIIYVGGPIFGF